jgi:hypothetical protein
MSGFQLVASLASSLAWPIVVAAGFIFVWIKRDEVGRLFNSRAMTQGRTLRRVRAGPVELEWEQLIETTAEKIPESPAAVSTLGKSVRQELATIADSVPAAAVLEASARLERRLRELYGSLRNEDGASPAGKYPSRAAFGQMVRLLTANGSFSPETEEALLNLTRLRNEAAHRVGGADITTSQAYDYLELVDRVLDYLRDIPENSTG